MGASQNLPSLNCELRIIRARNVEFISTGNLFVRYYLQTENNRRIQLNTRGISAKFDPYWNESISLECLGGQDAIDKLKKQSVVFELRWRNGKSILGKIGGSKLLARGEIEWKDVLDSAELSIDKWVNSVTTSRHVLEGLKPPAIQIGMKVMVQGKVEMAKRRRECGLRKWNECGCRHGECNGRDEDIFALAATLEML